MNIEKSLFHFLIFPGVLMVFLVSSCDHNKGDPVPYVIVTGTVSDSLTGTPIDSAKIIHGDTLTSKQIYYTNDLGVYQATHLDFSGDSVTLYCLKEGYRTKENKFSLDVYLSQGKNIIRDIDFKLKPVTE